MDQFMLLIKSKDLNRKKYHTIKRIHLLYNKYCHDRNIHHIPPTFIETESEEFLSLELCRNSNCMSFHLLECSYYVCKDHLLLHYCYFGSKTCNKGFGERGVIFCKFSGNELSKYNAISNELFSLPQQDVDTFDGNTINSNAVNSFVKSQTYVKKSELLFQTLSRNIENIVYKILDPTLRKTHNEIVVKTKTLKNNTLPIYDMSNKDCCTEIIQDVMLLCNTSLCHTHDKKKTLLLLKNMNSFVSYMLGISMKGLYVEGMLVRSPSNSAKKFYPMPCNIMLKKVFNIKLTKFADCMKCLQTIVEEKGFLRKVTRI